MMSKDPGERMITDLNAGPLYDGVFQCSGIAPELKSDARAINIERLQDMMAEVDRIHPAAV